jgi:agmatine/peptidylarginine deiminase
VPCYLNIIQVIASYQPVLVVCDSIADVLAYLKNIEPSNIYLVEAPINDTWARDYGAITVKSAVGFRILDFTFNGWGDKFVADKDDKVTHHLYSNGVFNTSDYLQTDLVLEGGSIESDGLGTLLTTTNCLLTPTRNPHLSKVEIEDKLKHLFGLERILWLESGHLEGDDTDAHIDTLARFCDANTIAYVQCTDSQDHHYEGLKQMESELQQFRIANGNPYRLIPLPMAEAVYAPDVGRRLPATYANFLIMNDAVLVPTYNSLKQDAQALQQLEKAFPMKKVVGVDCSALILQHGSLHCITMQYPKGSINWEVMNTFALSSFL